MRWWHIYNIAKKCRGNAFGIKRFILTEFMSYMEDKNMTSFKGLHTTDLDKPAFAELLFFFKSGINMAEPKGGKHYYAYSASEAEAGIWRKIRINRNNVFIYLFYLKKKVMFGIGIDGPHISNNRRLQRAFMSAKITGRHLDFSIDKEDCHDFNCSIEIKRLINWQTRDGQIQLNYFATTIMELMAIVRKRLKL